MKERYPGMRICEVCGREFPLMHEFRYTVRDEERGGLAAAFRDLPEPTLWDAFDCPYCGCQNRVKERKREVKEPTEMANTADAAGDACGECGLSEVCPLSRAVDERDEDHGR